MNMKMNHSCTLQMELKLIDADIPKKSIAGFNTFRCINDFRHFIEETDWDRHLLEKYGRMADLFCWGLVALSTMFFLYTGLTIILK